MTQILRHIDPTEAWIALVSCSGVVSDKLWLVELVQGFLTIYQKIDDIGGSSVHFCIGDHHCRWGLSVRQGSQQHGSHVFVVTWGQVGLGFGRPIHTYPHCLLLVCPFHHRCRYGFRCRYRWTHTHKCNNIDSYIYACICLQYLLGCLCSL